MLANTSSSDSFQGFALVDFALNPDGSQLVGLYSNKVGAASPAPCVTRAAGTVTIHQLDGSTSAGPVRAVPVSLQPLEVKILGPVR